VGPAEDDTAVAFPALVCVPERDVSQPPALDRYRDYAGIGPFDPDDVDDQCYDHRRLGFPVPNCRSVVGSLSVKSNLKTIEGCYCVRPRYDIQTRWSAPLPLGRPRHAARLDALWHSADDVTLETHYCRRHSHRTPQKIVV